MISRNNLYNRLFTYRPEEEKSSSENFITEAFVYLLEYSWENRTDFFNHFIKFLGLNNADYNLVIVYIDTQRSFKTMHGMYAIPDITIQIDKTLIFIEVKYESSINHYEIAGTPT